jgi:ATP-dependent protease ClpP protease subunit
MLKNKYEVKQIGEQKTLELYLYGEIETDYYDWWTGKTIESKTSANYVRKVLDEAGNVDRINVYINSIGGSVSEGNAIYNILKRSPAEKVVYVDAFAYSVASVIAMAGDKIIMPSNTTMMIHNAMWGIFGNSQQLRKAADDLDIINEASCNTYLVKAGDKLSKEDLTKMLDAETYLTAEKALEIGLCDEIANPVDLSESIEVVEQAQQKQNAFAKQAAQQIKAEVKAKEEPPKPQEQNPPQAQEKDVDKFEFATPIFNKYFNLKEN